MMKGTGQRNGHVIVQVVRQCLLTAQAQVEIRATKDAIADHSGRAV
jgi:hypothetical protein